MAEPWRRRGKERVTETVIFSVDRHRLVHPRHGTEHDFFILDAPDWCNIVPLTRDGQVVMVRQRRHGIEQGGVVLGGRGDARQAEQRSRRIVRMQRQLDAMRLRRWRHGLQELYKMPPEPLRIDAAIVQQPRRSEPLHLHHPAFDLGRAVRLLHGRDRGLAAERVAARTRDGRRCGRLLPVRLLRCRHRAGPLVHRHARDGLRHPHGDAPALCAEG